MSCRVETRTLKNKIIS